MMREHSRLRDDSDMEGEDEMTMFDQSSLLGASSSSGDGRRPTKRQKLLNTFALFGAFFGTVGIFVPCLSWCALVMLEIPCIEEKSCRNHIMCQKRKPSIPAVCISNSD